MASEFGSYLSSKLVEIRAQDGAANFTAHKDILIAQSTLFESSVSGNGTERLVDLSQWDGETVARVLEFLYRGRYSYPNPVHRLPEGKQPVTLSLGGESTHSSSRGEEVAGATDEYVETARERLARFDPSGSDYRGVLLAHARVYNLAQTASIVRLLSLALKHLSDTLSCFSESLLSSTPFLVQTVLELASYLYTNIFEPGAHRTLIARFIARNFAALNSTSSLGLLLAEGGPLVMDVMMCLHTRPATPAPVDSIAGAPSRYVAKLLVISKHYERDAPHDHLRDLHGGKSTLNYLNSSDYERWLIPTYTGVADDACTGISVVIDRGASSLPGVMSFAPDRYVVSTVDRAVTIKIANVALLRHSKHVPEVSAVPREYGCWDGMSTDLNRGRLGGYLYVLWQSVNVR